VWTYGTKTSRTSKATPKIAVAYTYEAGAVLNRAELSSSGIGHRASGILTQKSRARSNQLRGQGRASSGIGTVSTACSFVKARLDRQG
jgi:hypothetical protein